jgi:predicted phage terminase large subunit-like protein
MFQEIINILGEEKAATYFRRRFRDPANMLEMCALFPEHLKKPMPLFHKQMLKEAAKGGRLAIVSPRGSAKSTAIDVFTTSYFAFNAFQNFIVIISDTYAQAKLQLAALKYEIETNPMINWLYPKMQGEPWGEDRILLHTPNGDVMIYAIGAGMKIRGLRFRNHRPGLVIIDDLENLEAVDSLEQRQKLLRWFQYDLLRALDRDRGSIIYIGTVLHSDALMLKAVKQQGIFAGWRALFYQALQKDGSSLWPEMWSKEYLHAIRDNPKHQDFIGTYAFAQEMQNEPQDDRDRIIKLQWLREYNLKEKIAHFEGANDEERLKAFLKTLKIYGGVDPSISQKETADFFSFYTFGEDKEGNEYELDCVAGRFSVEKQAQVICDGFKKWHHEKIGIETIAYQAALNQLVRSESQKQHLFIKTVAIKTDKDKIRRAIKHSVSFESGHVYLRSDHGETETLRQEILDFPHAAHDDRFDSLMLTKEVAAKPRVRVFAKKPAGF